MRRIFTAWILLCLLLLLAWPMEALAASTSEAKEPVDPVRTCSLTVLYGRDGVAFSDISVSLYHVADISADYRYTLAEPFADTKLQLNGVSSQAEWSAIRTTVEMYIGGKKIQPLAVAVTDEQGQAEFADLRTGLYYVSFVRHTKDGMCYYFESALTAVPGLEPDGTWNYDVTVKPKSGVQNPGGKDLEYKVIKLWRGDDEEKRPKEVVVEIFRNGEPTKTVTLSAENNWCYTWFAENDGSYWLVMEKDIPRGYYVMIEQNDTIFSVINVAESNPDDPRPPQTGEVLNMYSFILIMSLSGVLLLMLGMFGKKVGRSG